MDAQLLREFLAEAEDLIEVLIGDTQTLRARHGEGRARRELIGRIFRHVHTIKGSAAAAGLDFVTEIAHEFESLLDQIRLGQTSIDDAALDVFDDATNAIAQSLNAVASGDAPPASRTLIERLRRVSLKTEPQSTDASPPLQERLLEALPEDIKTSLSEYETHRFREAAGEGLHLFVVAVGFDLMTFDERFRDLSDALAESGEMISTMPGHDASAPDQISFRIVYATDSTPDEAAARLAPFGNVVLTDLSAAAKTGEQENIHRVENKLEGETASASETAGAKEVEDAPSTILSLAPLSTLVRVELSGLDEIISATHELLTDTAGALDFALQQNLPRGEQTEMEIRAARIRRRFVELEERLIDLRMVAIGQTLQRAARAGAMAARSIDKEVDFETAGNDVRIDKSLADAISEPLLHLLRNAIDHGIEAPDERLRAGKEKRGSVLIEAVAEGSRVRLRVTDDGRGIDPERIARAAVERGIIDAHAKITKEQSLRLIFRPGFSTAASVSNVSGRGVGLDVVESAVEKIGGELSVAGEYGAGTTFEMLLPTTLALVPSLVVRSSGYAYCIDASHISEAGFVESSEIESVGQARVVRWRGQVMPLVELRELLAQDAIPVTGAEQKKRVPVVVSHVAGRRRGEEAGEQLKHAVVALDEWDGHREVLVRGLGRHASRWRGISGATELRDGSVALMLDLPRLLEMAL
ncbi:MAG: chemotaxis protein CheA [Pyrinomonadaceae bacterium]